MARTGVECLSVGDFISVHRLRPIRWDDVWLAHIPCEDHGCTLGLSYPGDKPGDREWWIYHNGEKACGVYATVSTWEGHTFVEAIMKTLIKVSEEAHKK